MMVIYEQHFTTYSPTLAFNSMEYFVGNISPIYFLLLQISVIATTVLHFRQNQQFGLVQCTHAKSYDNYKWILGTSIAITTLVLSIPLSNIFIIYSVLYLSKIMGLEFGNVPEFYSITNLVFIDLPVTLFLYCCITLFLTQFLRSSLLAVIVSSALVLTHSILIGFLPFEWLELVSYSTSSTLLVSEIMPVFNSMWILLDRGATILISLTLLLIVSIVSTRKDGLATVYKRISLVSVLFAAALIAIHASVIAGSNSRNTGYSSTDDSALLQNGLELSLLRGKVEIDPGVRLTVNYDLKVRSKGSLSSEHLEFWFNPGFTVNRVLVNGEGSSYTFQDGLLQISLQPSQTQLEEWRVALDGTGVLDTDFGYFNPHIDFLGESGLSQQLPKLLGTKNSLFDDRYIALMPGSYWYPVPLRTQAQHLMSSLEIPADLFRVELDLFVKNRTNWRVAGPDVRTISRDPLHTEIYTHGEITDFAIFFSNFEEKTLHTDNLDLRLFAHSNEIRNLDLEDIRLRYLIEAIEERIGELTSIGLPFPYKELTFVEVPNHLRMIGGYDMPYLISQPGLILVKESNHLLKKFTLAERYIEDLRISGDEFTRYAREILENYDYQDVVGNSVLVAAANQYLYPLYETPNWRNTSLHFLKRMYVTDMMLGPEFYYVPSDIEFAVEIADLTSIHPALVLDRLLRRYELPDSAYLKYEAYARFLKDDLSFARVSLRVSDLLKNGDRRGLVFSNVLRLVNAYRAFKALYGIETVKYLLEVVPNGRISDEGVSSVADPDIMFAEKKKEFLDVLEEWTQSGSIPSYSLSKLVVTQNWMSDQGSVYRASFKIRNDSAADGIVSFYVENALEYVDTGVCIRIPKGVAYVVNLYSEEYIESVLIDTYYSRHFGSVSLTPTYLRDSERNVVNEENPLPSYKLTSWEPGDEEIVVDNLDEGFSFLGLNSSALNRVGSIQWPWEFHDSPFDRVMGLKVFDVFALRRNTTWRYLEDWMEPYGRYRKSAFATTGENVEVARFSIDVPVAGKWALAYHFPQSTSFNNRYGTHIFSLDDGRDLKRSLEIVPNGNDGWLQMGEFHLPAATVNLDLLSVDPPKSVRVADAVQLTLVED